MEFNRVDLVKIGFEDNFLDSSSSFKLASELFHEISGVILFLLGAWSA